ncbi:MAG: GAF domain-containing protein [Coprothermobacterota bacterium]|nr:GAF domain-containing protein [Coprothermobacterota bacterium]
MTKQPAAASSQSLAPEEKPLEECRQVELDRQTHEGEFSEAPWQTLALEHMVSAISRRFLAASPERLEEEILRAIQVITQFIGADRGYLALLDPEGLIIESIYEWCGPGLQPNRGRLEGSSVAEMGWAFARFLAGEAIHVPQLADLPPEATGDQRVWHELGIQSLLAFPLLLKGKLLGFLGLIAEGQERQWSPVDIRLIRLVSEIFTSTLARSRMEERAFRLNRLYAFICRSQEAMVRAEDRFSLFCQTCRVAVEEGAFRMAWIGLVDPEGLVVPVAHWGMEERYLDSIRIDARTWPTEGPTGTALHTGHHVLVQDIATNPRTVSWRQDALKRGYRAMAAFPIGQGERQIGTFNLYAEVPHYFDEEIVALLDRLAEMLSYAMERFAAKESDRAGNGSCPGES